MPVPEPEHVSRLAYGFNRIARDLDRAIRMALSVKAQHYLVGEARELSWSFAGDDPLPFPLNFSAISRDSGIARSSLRRQCEELVACHIFLALKDGRYLINKDYRQWTHLDGSPRLSEAQIRRCLSIQKRLRPGSKRSTPLEHLDPPPLGLNAPPPGASGPTPLGLNAPPPGSKRSTPISPPPDPPIGERADLESFNESAAESLNESGGATGAPVDSPPAAVERNGFHQSPNPPSGEAVALALELFGPKVARSVSGNVGDITRTLGGRWDCYAAALRRAWHNTQRPGASPIANLHAYCLGIAKDYAVTGIPPAPVSWAAKPRETESQRKDRVWREQAADAIAKACDDLEREGA